MKQELIKFLKGLSRVELNNYSPEEALYYAVEEGLIKTFEQVSHEIIGARRWGHDAEIIFDIDDCYYLRFDVYEMTSNEGEDPDELEDIVEVRQVEKTIKVWEEV